MQRDDEFSPSASQIEDGWMRYVIADAGCDDAGWWIGRCPLHDRQCMGEPSALFNFARSAMRCLLEEPCTGFRYGKGRAMSLTNVMRQMVNE